MNRMQKCVAEGVRMLHRLHIEKSESITYQVDVRCPRLTVRFAAGRRDILATRRGVVGHVIYVRHNNLRHDDSSAYAKSTLECVHQFCTFMIGTKLERPIEQMHDHMRNRCEMINADAAKTAQLANEELTNKPGDEETPGLSNATMSIDFTHGMRRVAERPFNAVPDVENAVETVTLGQHTIVQRTRHSPEFR